MDMNFIIASLLVIFLLWVVVAGIRIMFREMTGNQPKQKYKKLEPGMILSNRRGSMIRVNDRGYLERSGTLAEFLDNPKVQSDLRKMERLYKVQVIEALWNGDRPPHKVGELMEMTKHRLQIEWNDEWQAVLDELSHYMDISYNKLFDIEEPEVVELTAEEIAAEYVEEENDKEERTSKSTIRRYAGSNRSLRL